MTARKADDDWVLWNEKSAHGDPERSQSFVVSSQMKHFLFLIKTRKDRLASLSPEQMQQHVVNVRQFIESWKTEIQPILDVEGVGESEGPLEESQLGL